MDLIKDEKSFLKRSLSSDRLNKTDNKRQSFLKDEKDSSESTISRKSENDTIAELPKHGIG